MQVDGNSRFVDLSHTIEDGLITYRGLPAPLICDFLSRQQSEQHYAPGVSFQIGKIEMVANTGTYLDSPFHRYAEGKDLSEVPLSSLADLPLVVVRSDAARIDQTWFRDLDVAGKAVLVQTGWSELWNTDDYFEGHPFLTEDAARSLRDGGAALVGIDSYNIDDVEDGRRPVHSLLLDAEIPIVEHLTNLSAAPTEGARFFATPVKVKAMGTFPVRAYAILDR